MSKRLEMLMGRVAMIRNHGVKGDLFVAMRVLDLEPDNASILPADYDTAVAVLAYYS